MFCVVLTGMSTTRINRGYNVNSPNFTALPKKYKFVDNTLLRGPHPSICDVFRLKKEGVTQIYDFRHVSVRGMKFAERFACRIAGIKYIRKPFSFLTGKYPSKLDYETISKSVADNGKNGGKTLFHCRSGTHRTSLMSAFYQITKGKPVKECISSDGKYSETVEKVMNDQIKNTNFFSRNRVDITTKNPFKRMKNIYNNRVEKATKTAYNMFVDFISV